MVLGKEDIDHKIYFLSKTSFGNFFLRRIQRNIDTSICFSLFKVPVTLVRF